MLRRIAITTSLFVLCTAAPALAQTSPFGPLPDAETATPVATATSTASQSTETGRNTLFIILAALLVGFAVMGWFILRDARRVEPGADTMQMRDAGPHKHEKQAKAKARARTRAQKQARKANRPRA